MKVNLKHTCPDELVDVCDNKRWEQILKLKAQCPACLQRQIEITERKMSTYGGGVRPVNAEHERLLNFFGVPQDERTK